MSRILHAIATDDDMPRFLATQVRGEIEVAERRFGQLADGQPVDLDAIIKRLLLRSHPAPVLR